MRGVVYDGNDYQVIDDLSVRDPGPGEIAVRIEAALDIVEADHVGAHLGERHAAQRRSDEGRAGARTPITDGGLMPPSDSSRREFLKLAATAAVVASAAKDVKAEDKPAVGCGGKAGGAVLLRVVKRPRLIRRRRLVPRSRSKEPEPRPFARRCCRERGYIRRFRTKCLI